MDAKWAVRNATIDQQKNTNGQYFSDYRVQRDDDLYFIFKSIPNDCQVGIGSPNSNEIVSRFRQNPDKTNICRNYLNNSEYNSNWLKTHSMNFGGKVERYDSIDDKITYHFDGVPLDWWRFRWNDTHNTIRIDKYDGDDYEIDAYIL